jgi:hypothetical protein
MKLMVRVSVFGLVFAGAVASAFSSKVTVPTQATHSNMVISNSMPVPACEPGQPGCLPY